MNNTVQPWENQTLESTKCVCCTSSNIFSVILCQLETAGSLGRQVQKSLCRHREIHSQWFKVK